MAKGKAVGHEASPTKATNIEHHVIGNGGELHQLAARHAPAHDDYHRYGHRR